MTLLALATDGPARPEPSAYAGLIEQALTALEDGEHDTAIQLCEKALGPGRNRPEALYVLGLINIELEDPVTGLKLMEMAHELAPDIQEFAEMLAAVYASLGNVGESLFYAKLGTSLSPHSKIAGLLPERYGSFFFNLERGRSDLYLSRARRKLADNDPKNAVRDCETQLELTPGDPDTLRALAEGCLATGQISRAVSSLQSVLDSEERTAGDLAAIGEALAAAGRPDEALSRFRAALDEAETGSKAAVFSRLLAAALETPGAAPGVVEQLHAEWRHDIASTLRSADPAPQADEDPERALRIGYVCDRFYANDFMTLFEPVLHSHKRDRFEIYCYADGKRTDLVTERIQRATNRWIDIDRIDDETLAQILRGDQIDIAVDLTGHGPRSRALMLARRPSPISVAWLGYLHPLGLEQIDYFLADPVCCPEETSAGDPAGDGIWRLENGVCTFLAPTLMPEVTPLPATAAGHVTFGARCDLRRIDSEAAALWARVLKAVPHSRLSICNALGSDEEAVDRCLELFSRHGVKDRVGIVDFTDNSDTDFEFYRQIDIALDPPGLNEIAELCRALWMGVPVLSLLHFIRIQAM